MALIRLDHLPETTKVTQPLTILLPDPGGMNGKPVRERKVLYLLHGLSDDGTAWQRFSSIEIVAREYGLVVVMPSVGRSFYADLPNGQNYFTYLLEELPQYLSDVFDLSPRREDTLIAGLSMGGYGAFKAAFLHPERFAAAGSFQDSSRWSSSKPTRKIPDLLNSPPPWEIFTIWQAACMILRPGSGLCRRTRLIHRSCTCPAAQMMTCSP